jgi:hypothetical protein
MNSRCGSCGKKTIKYVGDPLADRGTWSCPCGYSVVGRAPDEADEKPKQDWEKLRRPRPDGHPEGFHRIERPPDPILPPEAPPAPSAPISLLIPEPALRPRPRISEILAATCAVLGIGCSDLLRTVDQTASDTDRPGVSRHKRYTLAREIVATLAHEMAGMSWPEIAPFISPAGAEREDRKATHTTAFTAAKRFRLESSPKTAEEYLGEDDAAILGLRGCRVFGIAELIRIKLTTQQRSSQ